MSYEGTGTAGNQLGSNAAGTLPSFQTPATSSICSFLIYVNTVINNVTGDGTLYEILYDTVSFDTGSNITLNSAGRTIFTAPITGKYFFSLNQRITGLDASMTYASCMFLNVTSSTLWNSSYFYQSGGASITLGLVNQISLNLNANDVVVTTLAAAGSTKTADVQGAVAGEPDNYWSGYLIGL